MVQDITGDKEDFNMAFNSNIPQPTDQMSQSQQDILDNFTEINTFVTVDHVAFNGVNQGQHAKVTLPVLAAPAFPNPATDGGFYNAAYATSTKNEVFVHKHNSAADVDIPMTASILGSNPAPGTSGWTYLPSGILLKWGQSGFSNAGVAVNLNAGGDLGPNFTALYNVQATAENGQSFVRVGYTGAPATVTLFSDITGAACRWLAIGS